MPWFHRKAEALQIAFGAPPPIEPENFDFVLPRMYFNEVQMRSQHQELYDSVRSIGAARQIVDRGTMSLDAKSGDMLCLAKASFLSGEDRFAGFLAEQTLEWIRENPPFRGKVWNPLDAAVRLIHWTWAFSLARDGLDPSLHRKMQELIYRHAQYLSVKLPWTNDLAESLVASSALAVAGGHFSLFDKAEAWEKQGWRVLNERIDALLAISESKEILRSTSFMLEYAIAAYAVAKTKRLALPVSMLMKMEKIVERLLERQESSQRGTEVPHLPFAMDVDSRRLLMNAIAIIRANKAFKNAAQPLDEWTFWVFGDQAVVHYNKV